MPFEQAEAAGSAAPAPTGWRAWRAAWPRGTLLAALGLVLMLVPGWLAGGAPLVAAHAFLFYFGWVVLPGLGLAALLASEEDELVTAGFGLALGAVLLGLLVFVCRATGWFELLFAWPAVTLVWWVCLRRRRKAPGADSTAARAAPSRGTWLILLPLVVAFLRVPTGLSGPIEGWYLIKRDLIYHAANAAELLHSGPLTDPRLAGTPLNYHLLSHALAAAASVVTGESIADLFRFWFMGFFPLVLVLLVFALARKLARGIASGVSASAAGVSASAAGAIAALVLVLHVDPARTFAERRVAAAPLDFLSHLNLGLFLSPPTSLGLALLAALGLALVRWSDPSRRPDKRAVLLLALLALGASMAKGSVMPVAVSGALFALLVQSLRARRLDRRWLAAALVLLVASLPATLYLSLGPGSYAGAMFRLVPFATATTSGMGQWMLARFDWLARAPSWLAGLLVTLPWLPGFLGLGGIGAVAWLAAGRPELRGLGPWVLGVCLAGLGAAVLLLAPGAQLFFAYDAQVLLALPAGVGAVALWHKRRGIAVALALLALPLYAGGANATWRDLRYRALYAQHGPELWPRWREGAEWLRQNAGHEALLVTPADGPFWTQFAERRVALADPSVTPEGRAASWQRVDGEWRSGPPAENVHPELQAACETALRAGDAAALARVRAVTGHRGELYLVLDRVNERDFTMQPLGASRALDSSPVLERCLRNEAVAIYRALD